MNSVYSQEFTNDQFSTPCLVYLSAPGLNRRIQNRLFLRDLDDFVLITESLPDLERKFQVWKQSPKSKDLRFNLAKKKNRAFVSRKADKSQIPYGKWPCSIYKKGVGRNSVHCTQCKTHEWCSNITGKLTEKIVFACGKCAGKHKKCTDSLKYFAGNHQNQQIAFVTQATKLAAVEGVLKVQLLE